MSFEVNDDRVVFNDAYSQKVEFCTDNQGDYYFTIYSNYEARSGDAYRFYIDNKSLVVLFKKFIEKESQLSEKEIRKNPYFLIKQDYIRIANQSKSIIEAESLEIVLYENKIILTFSNKFPSLVRINGVGRMDTYPYFIPLIDLFNEIQNASKEQPSCLRKKSIT